MDNKFNIGNKVKIPRYEIEDAIIVEVEKVTSYDENAAFDRESIEVAFELLETFQYGVLVKEDGIIKRDWYLECYIEMQ